MKIPQLCTVGETLTMWGLSTFINHIENCEQCCKVNLLQVTEPENNFKYINNKPKNNVQQNKTIQDNLKRTKTISGRNNRKKGKQDTH